MSYDTNLRLGLWPLELARQTIHETIAKCDIALPGLDDASQLTGLTAPDDIADFYLQLGVSVVALTLGAKGTLVATTQERATIPSFPVESVDATAAGDTFDGAFLAQLLAGASPFDAARYANATAALSTTGMGRSRLFPHAHKLPPLWLHMALAPLYNSGFQHWPVFRYALIAKAG